MSSAPIPGLAEAQKAETPKNIYGESFVNADAAEHRTPDEIVDEGRGIFETVRLAQAHGLDLEDTERVQELEAKLRKEHPEFAGQFPVPFRWMIQAGQFDPELFRRWLIATQGKKMWNNRAEWLESQGVYLGRLYAKSKPHASAKEVGAFTRQTIKALQDEEAKHKEIVQEVKDEMDAKAAEATEALRARLKSRLLGPGRDVVLERLKWSIDNNYSRDAPAGGADAPPSEAFSSP